MPLTDDDENPFAPPTTSAALATPPPTPVASDNDYAEALHLLDEHIQDAEAQALDRRLAGRRIRVGTIIAGIVTVGLLVGGAGYWWSIRNEPFDEAGQLLALLPVGLGAVGFIITLVLLSTNLALPDRWRADDPEATWRAYLTAVAQGRYGYIKSLLSPGARQRPLPGALVSGTPFQHRGGGWPDQESLSAIKGFLGSWAYDDRQFVRRWRVLSVSARPYQDRVMIVESTLKVTSFPTWVRTVGVVLFVVLRLLLLIWVFIYLANLTKTTVQTRHVLLLGSNGLWYIHDHRMDRRTVRAI